MTLALPRAARLFPEFGGQRAILLAIGLSVVAHLLLLVFPSKSPPETATPISAQLRGPFTAQLSAPEPAPPPVRTEREVAPKVPSRPRAAPPPAPPELVVPRAERSVAPPPVPEPAPVPRPEPQFDMAALIAANRERRRAAESAAVRGAPQGNPMGSDTGAAALSRNLQSLAQSDGTGGVFEILRMGTRTGEFAFNGWRPERGKRWREVIEVDAGQGGDLERATVRRMIALIREHYSGDFNWQSYRQGRVVVLNAAPERNEELEDYLMREFFGTPVVKRGN